MFEKNNFLKINAKMGNSKTKKEKNVSGCFWGIDPLDYVYAGDCFNSISVYDKSDIYKYIHFIMYFGKDKDDIALNLVIPKNFRLTHFLETWMKNFHSKCRYMFSTTATETHFIFHIIDMDKNLLLFNANGFFIKEFKITDSMKKRVEFVV